MVSFTFIVVCPAPLSAQVDTAWVRRYDGIGNREDYAYALTVDDSENVFVTGASRSLGGYFDYVTVKYYANGDTAWVRRYEGAEDYDDEARALAIDNLGNVYVTGHSWSTYGDDYVTIKYYPNGDTAWVRSYDGPGGSDRATALAVDNSGNVYVTGWSVGMGTSSDYATVKYYANGDTAWIRRYDGPLIFEDYAYALAVDDSGNVFITGASRGTGGYGEYATIKYHPDGDTAWIRRYVGPGNYDDGAWALAVDKSGSVYVTGESHGSGTYSDFATIKYYANGDTAWVRRYDGPGSGWDRANAVAVDNSGNVYVTGRCWMGYSTYYDYTTIVYYANGDTAWVRMYDGPANYNDEAKAIAVDSAGNVYVTGSSWLSTTDDYATIKYHSNGDAAWVIRYDGLGLGMDRANALAIDDSANVYVTGESDGSGSGSDYATIKYVQTPGIEEYEHALPSARCDFNIYPNPARNHFTIRMPQSDGYPVIKIFNVAGQKIGEFACQSQGSEHRVSVTDIKPGVYFVQINNESTVSKIIVTK